MTTNTPLPLTYRADLLREVMPALQAGECCSLVGTSGVGKSNLVRFLQRPDVQHHYWGEEPVWMVLIDTNGLFFEGQPDLYAVAELIIHQLVREAERREWDSRQVADFDARHLRLVEGRNPLLAIRTLERICGQLCEAGGVRLVLLFDQFEDLWARGDGRLFLHLRHLRDELKYRLSYLVMSRERLQRTRERTRGDLPEVESFWELFTSHTYGIGPYVAADADHMIDRLATRGGIAVSHVLREAVLGGSGGHPGLLRALVWGLSRGMHDDDPLAIEAVAEECAKIWDDLMPEERLVLRAAASGRGTAFVDEDALNEVRLKRLVDGTPPRIFSPILRAYIERQTGSLTGLLVDLRLRQTWLDGALLPRLPRLEFKLLAFLAEHTSRVCSREEIINHLYGDDGPTPGDDRLDALIRRVREALGESATTARYLLTHRGVGFQLLNARVQE